MSAAVVTLVAPWLHHIERQMEREIAALLHRVATRPRIREPLLDLMEQHYRHFGSAGAGREQSRNLGSDLVLGTALPPLSMRG